MAAFYKLNEWVDEVIKEYKGQKDEAIESQPNSFKFRQRKQNIPNLVRISCLFQIIKNINSVGEQAPSAPNLAQKKERTGNSNDSTPTNSFLTPPTNLKTN